MAETKKLYTLADILGEPITEQEAQNLIRKETNSDEQTFQNYVNLNETYRNKLLHFIMGKNGLSITYDTVFRHVMLPGGDTKRLEHFLSIIFDQPIHIKQILPRYRDIISFRRRPKDLITTFSDALREMDRNTEIYMVEQLAKEVQEKDHALAEKYNVIAEKDNALAEQARLIEQLKKQLAETRSTD